VFLVSLRPASNPTQPAMNHSSRAIPIVDLFAGPGGLGEGFSQVKTNKNVGAFRIGLSIEKDVTAHRTLELRAIYRWFAGRRLPDVYWDYLRGARSREQLLQDPAMAEAVAHAREEARCAELGVTSEAEVNRWIKEALSGQRDWVLLGGPPCQAYSLVGRARQSRKPREEFERDGRHLLYEEYLRIVRTFHPAVFVMENVKGILSATYGGEKIFQRICNDLSLSTSNSGYSYEIRSFVARKRGLDPRDFVIRSEEYGIPQARHRVILLGIRSDLSERMHRVLARRRRRVSVKTVLRALPSLRSRVSRGKDTHAIWLEELALTPHFLDGLQDGLRRKLVPAMKRALRGAEGVRDTGGRFVDSCLQTPVPRRRLMAWLRNGAPAGWLNHESRGHMPEDLRRYLFASTYAQVFRRSPKVMDFPYLLQPDHENVSGRKAKVDGLIPFADRFRVQRAGFPSTTVVSHIAKDGHYFIHYEPAQARSLTVREAARLQTFPDNYFFEGNRTEQFTQVGNAVPPYLAYQLGEIVRDLIISAS
jgi:DNA (cytosine-5)-methyltransferase 1